MRRKWSLAKGLSSNTAVQLGAAATVLIAGACDVEKYRDKKRYESMKRGYEVYHLPEGMDSLTAGRLASDDALRRYRRYRLAAGKDKVGFDLKFEEGPGGRATRRCSFFPQIDPSGPNPGAPLSSAGMWVCVDETGDVHWFPGRESGGNDYLTFPEGKLGSSEIGVDASTQTSADGLERLRRQGVSDLRFVVMMPRGESVPEAEKTPGQPSFISDMEYPWSDKILEAAKETVTTEEPKGKKVTEKKLSQDMIRALSSTASVAQMRDLLTEPSFPGIVPVERFVDLGCLPPPESAVFTASSKLNAMLEATYKGVFTGSGAFTREYATAVTKLFEESERTLFLQYALFRLCEMSVNAPAEFHNVYPIIIHDIVRRTAEMNEWVEVEKTRQLALQVKLEELKNSGTITPLSTKTPAEPTKQLGTVTSTPTSTPATTPTTTPSQSPTTSPTTKASLFRW